MAFSQKLNDHGRNFIIALQYLSSTCNKETNFWFHLSSSISRYNFKVLQVFPAGNHVMFGVFQYSADQSGKFREVRSGFFFFIVCIRLSIELRQLKIKWGFICARNAIISVQVSAFSSLPLPHLLDPLRATIDQAAG